jgi:hypothetical protein
LELEFVDDRLLFRDAPGVGFGALHRQQYAVLRGIFSMASGVCAAGSLGNSFGGRGQHAKQRG